MADATVLIEPGGLSVRTDAQGRFMIASPEKVLRVAVYHLQLDRTGIGSLTASVAETRNARLTLATPSLATIWPRLCPGTPRRAGLGAVLFGSTSTASGAARIAGARVRVSWDAGPASATGARQVDVRTDSTGTFYACGVPDLEAVYLVSWSREFASGSIALAGDSLPLRKQDLVLGRVVDTLTSRTEATGVVRGRVRDSRRVPIPNATVEIDGAVSTVRTDTGGRFVFGNAPTGSRMVLVRAVGHVPAAQPIEVLDRPGDEVLIELIRAPIVLPNVRVTERERLPILRQEFEERRKQGFGVFLDSLQVARRFTHRNIFEGIPNLEVLGTDRATFTLWTLGLFPGERGCQANVYLDGRRSSTEELRTYDKDFFVGVEVYVRQINAPAQFRPPGNACGVVLVWTKMAFAR